MSVPTLRAELAAAIRAVNAAHSRLTAEERERVHLISDEPLDAALLDGTRTQALAQIERWRDCQLAAIEEATQWAA